MTKDSVKENLFLLLQEVLGVSDIDINKTMDDIPEWDSLKHIQLLSAIETKFELKIDFEDSINMVDVKGILNIISQKLIH
jgi:acyl carrier protein